MGGRDPHRDLGTAFRHASQFLLLVVLVLVAVNTIKPAYWGWLTPPPPLEIQEVADETALEFYHAALCCPLGGSTEQRRSILREFGLLELDYVETEDERGAFVEPDVNLLFERVAFHGRAVEHVRERANAIGWIFLTMLVALSNRRIGYPPERALLMLIPFFYVLFVINVLWRHSSPTKYWQDPSVTPETQPSTEPIV